MNKEFCTKGADYFKNQVGLLIKAKMQILKTPSINSVHQVRTSCRRIISSFRFYKKYIKKEEYKKYSEIFTSLMSKSGKIRDLDVLSLYLRKNLKSGVDSKYREGIKRVNLRIKQKREKLIPNLVDELNAFNIDTLQTDFMEIFDRKYLKNEEKNPVKTKTKVIKKFINFIENCSFVTDSYYSVVIDETEVEKLHAYRKEIKLQRYTLEFFNAQFGFNLNSQIKIMKKYQELLGGIHDADIWIDFFKDFLVKEERKTLKYFGKKAPMNEITPGINYLISALTVKRKKEYEEFVEKFKQELGNNYWINIYSIVTQ